MQREDKPEATSSLIIAVGQGNLDLVRKLLASETVDLEEKNAAGQTPLLLAIQLGNLKIVQELLPVADLSYDKAFTLALNLGNVDIIQALQIQRIVCNIIGVLDKNQDDLENFKAYYNERSALIKAIAQLVQTKLTNLVQRGMHSVAMLDLIGDQLIQQLQTPEMLNSMDDFLGENAPKSGLLGFFSGVGDVIITKFSKSSLESVTKRLIKNSIKEITTIPSPTKKATKHEQERNGMTDLMVAAYTGNSKKLKKILKVLHLGNIDELYAQDKFGRTPLIHAVLSGDIQTAVLLMTYVEDIGDKNGMTALMYAAEAGNAALIKAYYRVYSDKKYAKKRLAILDGVSYKHGANRVEVEVGNNFGRTALMHAVAHNKLEAAVVLLVNGEKDRCDKSDRSALMYAAETGNLVMVRVLLAAGVDPNIKNLAGHTVLTLTQEQAKLYKEDASKQKIYSAIIKEISDAVKTSKAVKTAKQERAVKVEKKPTPRPGRSSVLPRSSLKLGKLFKLLLHVPFLVDAKNMHEQIGEAPQIGSGSTTPGSEEVKASEKLRVSEKTSAVKAEGLDLTSDLSGSEPIIPIVSFSSVTKTEEESLVAHKIDPLVEPIEDLADELTATAYPPAITEAAAEYGFKASNLMFLRHLVNVPSDGPATISVPKFWGVRNADVVEHLNKYAPEWKKLWQEFIALQGSEAKVLGVEAKAKLTELRELIKSAFVDHTFAVADLPDDTLFMVRSTSNEDRVNHCCKKSTYI